MALYGRKILEDGERSGKKLNSSTKQKKRKKKTFKKEIKIFTFSKL